ncbi:hypothetical protein FLAVO9R_50053 [Flavobacterium sp. 9R]|nr:hypothetical protein FLAVO9R_50053 [Flavobacterium sp. 9R]
MKQFMKSTSIKIRFNLLHPSHPWLVNINYVNSKMSDSIPFHSMIIFVYVKF